MTDAERVPTPEQPDAAYRVEQVAASEVEVGDVLLTRDYYDKHGLNKAFGRFTVEEICNGAGGQVVLRYSPGRQEGYAPNDPVLRCVAEQVPTPEQPDTRAIAAFVSRDRDANCETYWCMACLGPKGPPMGAEAVAVSDLGGNEVCESCGKHLVVAEQVSAPASIDAGYVRSALAMMVQSGFTGPSYYAICKKLEDALKHAVSAPAEPTGAVRAALTTLVGLKDLAEHREAVGATTTGEAKAAKSAAWVAARAALSESPVAAERVVERDGLLDALEKAEREREQLRVTARHLSEQLLAAGLALGDSSGGRHYRDAAVNAERAIEATNPARWVRQVSPVPVAEATGDDPLSLPPNTALVNRAAAEATEEPT
jgi:hypothetical protein